MRKYDVPNTNWSMFYETTNALPKPLEDAVYSAIFGYLFEVSQNILPNLVNENLAIVFAPFIECPISFPDKNLLFIHKQELDDTSQTIFQLGHELLHTYYKSDLTTPMFWFEEVLCEVSSHLFLRTFANRWSKSSNLLIQGFTEFTLEYSDARLHEGKPVNLKSLPLNYLQANPTGDRDTNTYIASIILPIFENNPYFLAECRRLSTIYTETDLRDFFDKSYGLISSAYHSELRELESLFI
ncbi:hypothetical protein [Streptococcus sp. NLN64]|uniref:hypothetical protein n=1 Tax=Streptococcus sp. NLN64 TaxID=2822799 RepID=UPI0018CAE806|nr:hypothetical protein [Streptococcus sp. NLN64]MBG9366510.1 hypothetical protein [Streptococcus sp. NLN64]